MTGLVEYRIVNPHDDYSMLAPDDDVATTAVLLLGHMYGWAREDGTSALPGLAPADSPEGAKVLALAKAVVEMRGPEVADALRTVEIQRRRRLRLGVGAGAWHDEMRTSAADLRRSALHMATQLDRGRRAPEEVPLTESEQS